MSRLVPKVPTPPPLGAGFVKNASTGLYDVDRIVPQLLSGPLLATDLATVVRDTGPAGTPNLAPYSAAMSAVLIGGATPAPTPAPTPTSSAIPADGTLSGLPSTIVAGQPLSAVSVTSQTSRYFVLYKASGGVEEGPRWIGNVMPGNLNLLIPQTAATYTVRGYDASTAGNKVYESGQITVTAAPGALPATPTQGADTGATSSGVTMAWTPTGSSYRILARPGVGTAYGSLVDATVATNSYAFTGRPASSTVRAVIVPMNASGSGTPSGQFFSSTTA